MASDVTICQAICGVFLIILPLILHFVDDVAGEFKIATKSSHYVEETIFFELLEPEEISYTFKIRPAKGFGSKLISPIYNIPLVLAEPLDGCTPVTNGLIIHGHVAFMERGACSFVTKAVHAEQAGAVATVIMDNDVSNDDKMVDMIADETDRPVTIPAYFLNGKDGFMIRETLKHLDLIGAVINIPINGTGVPLHQFNQPPWTLW